MSLRERLQTEKAAKEEAKQAQRIESKEQDAISLKEQLTTLVETQEKLSTLSQRMLAAREQLQEARKSLKNERNTLRSLHQESVDEETGEALLPKPAELLRSEEFKDEEEVQQYEAAREAYRTLIEHSKGLAEELASVGIENAQDLLPTEVEKLLTEREAAHVKVVEQFLLEHPDVDPERAAQLKEHIVSSKAETISNDMYMTNLYSHFRENRERLSANRSFKEGVRTSLAEVTFGSGEMHEVMKVVQKQYDSSNETLHELDTDALARALVIRMTGREDYEDAETVVRSFAKERPELFKDEEMSLSEAFVIMQQEAANLPEVKRKAEEIMAAYTSLREYRDLPKEIARLEQRTQDIDRRLNDEAYTRTGTIESELHRIPSEQSLESAAQQNVERLHSLHDAAPRLLALKQLPPEVLDATLEVTPGGYGQKINAVITSGPDHSAEIATRRKFIESVQNPNGGAEGLQNLASRIASMKNGLFGPSKEKKELVALLQSQARTLSGKEISSENEVAGIVQELKTKAEDQDQENRKLIDEQYSFRDKARPLEEFGVLLSEYRFTGTVRDYIEKLQEKLKSSAASTEAEQQTLAQQKQEADEKRQELLDEQAKLQAEKLAISGKIKEIRTSEERLEHELFTKKVISQRKSPRY